MAAGLKQAGAEVTLKNVAGASTDELAGYDAVVFGCSMWGDCELQDDFIGFHAALSGISPDSKKAAVFGPGDSEDCHGTFCEAVGILEDALKRCGANIVTECLKVDCNVEPAFGDAEAWGVKVAGAL